MVEEYLCAGVVVSGSDGREATPSAFRCSSLVGGQELAYSRRLCGDKGLPGLVEASRRGESAVNVGSSGPTTHTPLPHPSQQTYNQESQPVIDGDERIGGSKPFDDRRGYTTSDERRSNE